MCIGLLPVDPRILVAPQILAGTALYLALALFFRMRPLAEIASMLLPRVRKRAPGIGAILDRVHRRCAK